MLVVKLHDTANTKLPCLIACLVLFGFVTIEKASGEESSLASLGQLLEKFQEQALQIEYEVTITSEPRGYDQKEVDRQVAKVDARLAPNAAERERTLEMFRKSLTQRTEFKSKGLFVAGKDFYANFLDKLTMWQIRRSPDNYEIGEDSLDIYRDPETRSEGWHDIARKSIGRLGKLDLATLAELKSGDVQIVKKGEMTILTKGNLIVAFAKEGENIELQSVQRLVPARKQREAVIYEGYKDFNGMSVPSKVTAIFDSAEGSCIKAYTVTGVKIGDDFSVPLINKDIGILFAMDRRFTPPLKYMAFRQLPDDSQIAEWVADPTTLTKYNTAMKKLRR